MGNICCCEEKENRLNPPLRPVPSNRSRTLTQQLKTQDNQVLDNQKQLLHDFGTALHYFKQHHKEHQYAKLTGFYMQKLISSDDICQYHQGYMVDQHGIQSFCIVKKINKSKINSLTQKKSIAIQFIVTKYIDYNFIINCCHTHEDQQFFYLLFDLRSYQHLNVYTAQNNNTALTQLFNKDLENNIRFVLAGIILALEKLHSIGIIYRGINTENIVIMDNGYPLLTNLARLHPEGFTVFNPAPSEFTSPEEFRGQTVTKGTDCWALGVLIYYLCKGCYINYSTFRQRSFKAEGVSEELTDLVNKLLIFKPEDRLGVEGMSSLKSHQFFHNFQWQQYQQMSLPSPLSIQKTNLHSQFSTKQISSQTSYCHLSDNSHSLLGTMLFIDFATLLLIDSAFYNSQKDAEGEQDNLEQENNNNNIDQFQLATEIDIGGDYD